MATRTVDNTAAKATEAETTTTTTTAPAASAKSTTTDPILVTATDSSSSQDNVDTPKLAKVASGQKPEGPIKVQVEEITSTAKEKDIRRHPKYPFSYEVRKYNDLYHIVERLGSTNKSYGFLKHFKGQYRELRRQLPLLLRFSKETLPHLGRRRIYASIIGNLAVKSFIPIIQRRARLQLAEVTIAAMQHRRMDWAAALKAIGADICSYGLAEAMTKRIDDNKAKLAYKYSNYIRERLIEARLGLDSVTTANEKVIGQFRSAEKLLARNWDSSFMVTQLTSIFSDLVNLVNDMLLVRDVARNHNSHLINWSCIVNLLFVVRQYTKYLRWGSKSVTAITDENFRRADIMSRASGNADAQDQVLGLRQYYYQEYKKAREMVGDASPNEPDTWDDSILHPWRSIAYKMVDKLNGAALCLLFALHVINQPSQSVVDASHAMKDMETLRSSTWQISYHLYYLLRHAQDFLDNLTPVERFYSLQQIKPLLKRRAQGVSYQKCSPSAESSNGGEVQEIGLSSHKSVVKDETEKSEVSLESQPPGLRMPTTMGMQIEFVNVSFTYPHKFKKALDNVSFKIEAGQLCSIVGFSGSDYGQILINDIDIADYDPDELYKAISFLFQTTRTTSLTIREFLRLGRLDATDEELEVAVKDSGADEIVKKFKKGLDTELEPRHLWDRAITLDMLVKRAQQSDEHELNWRGKSGGDEDDLEDETEDPRTDEELRQSLEAGLALLGGTPPAEANWTKLATKEALPAPSEKEEQVLAEGYDYKSVEEEEKKNQHDSAKFSGGEWSKIVLARSFLRNDADLLILDEFSASLDPLSEADIFDKFMKRRGQRTIIAVTHRFHLAYRSDLILFLQDGQLKEKGTHHELMRIGGKYKEMYLKTTNSSGKEVACQTDSMTGATETPPPEYETNENTTATRFDDATTATTVEMSGDGKAHGLSTENAKDEEVAADV